MRPAIGFPFWRCLLSAPNWQRQTLSPERSVVKGGVRGKAWKMSHKMQIKTQVSFEPQLDSLLCVCVCVCHCQRLLLSFMRLLMPPLQAATHWQGLKDGECFNIPREKETYMSNFDVPLVWKYLMYYAQYKVVFLAANSIRPFNFFVNKICVRCARCSFFSICPPLPLPFLLPP